MSTYPYLSPSEFLSEYNILSSQGKIAFYNQVKIFTIFFYYNSNPNEVFNFFTLVYFEEAENNPSSTPNNIFPMGAPFSENINGQKICIGLMETTVSLTAFSNWLSNYVTTKSWSIAQTPNPLGIGNLQFIPKVYVPCNGTYYSQLNQILKSNIQNGSYLLEEFDEEKSNLKIFLENPEKLLSISSKIQEYWPIKLASLTDRLGNILYQLPIDVIRTKFHNGQDDKSYEHEYEWDSRVTSPPDCDVISVSENRKENILKCLKRVNLTNSPMNPSVDNVSDHTIHLLFDKTNELILGSSTDTILKQIVVNMSIINPVPRIFEIRNNKHKVDIYTPHPIHVGVVPNSNSYERWIKDRIFEKETKDLEESLQFKQYGITANTGDSINDLHKLINKYGGSSKEVLLWDPYLNAEDIKNTLYFLKNTSVKCRAIGSYGKNKNREKLFQPSTKLSNIPFKKFINTNWRYIRAKLGLLNEGKYQKEQFVDWKNIQAAELSGTSPSSLCINLEFKAQYGNFSFQFHDRFLIFSKEDGNVDAWSLGTSINSFGEDHHILQKISNAKQVELAFNKMWNDLPNDPCLIWKSV